MTYHDNWASPLHPLYTTGAINNFYVTCIFCGAAMKKSWRSIRGHYNVKHNDKMDGLTARLLACKLTNVRGINADIDKVDIKHRLQIDAIYKATMSKMQQVELQEQSNSTAMQASIQKHHRNRRCRL